MKLPFDYTETEWITICESVQVIRKGQLPKNARKRLLEAAEEYMLGLEDDQKRDRRRKLKKRWEKIDSLARELRDEILGVTAEMPKFPLYLKEFLMSQAHLIGSMIGDIIGVWNDERPNPRLVYQARVLEIWVALGGELKISRHSKTQRVQGPLARYFFAVTRPVMGTSTPSPESLRGIVDRQKSFMMEVEPIEKDPKWYNFGAIYDWLRARIEAESERQLQKLEREVAIGRKLSGADQPTLVEAEHIIERSRL
jgi:hypothetical protein